MPIKCSILLGISIFIVDPEKVLSMFAMGILSSQALKYPNNSNFLAEKVLKINKILRVLLCMEETV